MGLSITNNVASLQAQNNLTRTSSALSKSLERLSSGLKINRGADGPAALVISEQQRAQIAGLQTAIDNASKAVSLVQTGEGALTEINALLVKIRGLSLDSANSGVQDVNTLAANQSEVSNALATIDRIANNTQFGTKKLLDGTAGISGSVTDTDVTFLRSTTDAVTGSYAVEVSTVGEKANVAATSFQSAALAQDETLTINGVQVTLKAGQTRAQVIDRINEFTGQTGVRADDNGGTSSGIRLISVNFGSSATVSVQSNVAGATNSSGFGVTSASDAGVNVAGSIGGIAATGSGNVLTATQGAAKGTALSFGLDGVDLVSTVTGTQGSVTVTDSSLVFQIGANSNQTAKIALDNAKTTALGIGVSGVQFTSLASIDVRTTTGAQDAIKVVDAAINELSTLRGKLGAFQQQTLESTANNLRATLENTVAAESVIRDTDFAAETAAFTKNQVLIQAGTTVLSNANATSQLVLALLGS